MLTESQGKFCSPQNISGASQQNSIATFPSTTDVDGDLFENVGEKNDVMIFTPFFKQKSSHSVKQLKQMGTWYKNHEKWPASNGSIHSFSVTQSLSSSEKPQSLKMKAAWYHPHFCLSLTAVALTTAGEGEWGGVVQRVKHFYRKVVVDGRQVEEAQDFHSGNCFWRPMWNQKSAVSRL